MATAPAASRCMPARSKPRKLSTVITIEGRASADITATSLERKIGAIGIDHRTDAFNGQDEQEELAPIRQLQLHDGALADTEFDQTAAQLVDLLGSTCASSVAPSTSMTSGSPPKWAAFWSEGVEQVRIPATIPMSGWLRCGPSSAWSQRTCHGP